MKAGSCVRSLDLPTLPRLEGGGTSRDYAVCRRTRASTNCVDRFIENHSTDVIKRQRNPGSGRCGKRAETCMILFSDQ